VVLLARRVLLVLQVKTVNLLVVQVLLARQVQMVHQGALVQMETMVHQGALVQMETMVLLVRRV
jgi:hypothetical protein